MLINNSYTTQKPFKCLRQNLNKIVHINKPSVCHIQDTLRPYMFERTQRTHTTNKIMQGIAIYSNYSSTRLVIDINAVAQSVERAAPGEEVLGSIPAVAVRSLLVELVSV